MVQTGYVIFADEKNAKIRIHRESSCGEHCAHCGGCEGREIIVDAPNTINIKTGETVKIIMDNKSFFKNALLGYVSLVFALILGGILGYVVFESDLGSGITAFLCLVILLLIYRIKYKKAKTDIKIERI